MGWSLPEMSTCDLMGEVVLYLALQKVGQIPGGDPSALHRWGRTGERWAVGWGIWLMVERRDCPPVLKILGYN